MIRKSYGLLEVVSRWGTIFVFAKPPMSKEHIEAFWEAAKKLPEIREKIKSSTQLKAVWLHDGDVDTQKEADAVVAIAKAAGFTITVEEALETF